MLCNSKLLESEGEVIMVENNYEVECSIYIALCYGIALILFIFVIPMMISLETASWGVGSSYEEIWALTVERALNFPFGWVFAFLLGSPIVVFLLEIHIKKQLREIRDQNTNKTLTERR